MYQSKRRRYLVVEKPAEKLHRWRYFKFICVRFYIIREQMNTHLLFRSSVEIEFVERETFPQTKRCRCSSFRIYSLWCHCRLHKDCRRDSCNACGGHGECSPGRVYTVRIRSTESCKTKSLVTCMYIQAGHPKLLLRQRICEKIPLHCHHLRRLPLPVLLIK